ncbi:hypothetical protein DB88DRAFT_486096 [Papiliotrema laurentii]|uniref:GATA-type domain-containing protein n=1 Tax=Papiliotrema laurentii TaxID=5418 RepID=A0AAD9FR91_PAPLA|nr:hypothetical protein DB88DRAFT_486096 [Papiliotrema laurentii]
MFPKTHPQATSTTQPNPPKPPPFLHTRFLRLSSSVQQTLHNLAPVSHTHLSSDTSSGGAAQSSAVSTPNSGAKNTAEAQSTAEKEMELIRKRRDWLITKAAQAKAAASAGSTSTPGGGGSTSASPSLSNLQSPHLIPPPVAPPHMYPLSNGYGASPPALSSQFPAFTYDRAYASPNTGRTAENPSGRCHSCGIQGAIEWRRGPDGARTLCDSCGLHYAKLSRRKTSASPVPTWYPPPPPLLG